MEAFITQCPNCGTAFEVSERELAIAEGIVRCGQCRHVFTATDFPVGEISRSPDPIEDDTPDFARQDDAESAMDLRATFRDTPQPQAVELDDDVRFNDDLGIEEAQAQLLEERQLKLSDDFLASASESGHAFSREVGNHDRDPILPGSPRTEPATQPAPADWDSRPFILDDEPAPVDPEQLHDDFTASGFEDEPDHDNRDDKGDEDTLTDLPLLTEENRDDALPDDETFDAVFSARDDDADDHPVADAPLRASLNSKLNRLDEPLEMRLERRPRLPRGDWGWLALVVIGLIALLTQYTVYRFDSLAANPRFQPLLKQACQWVGCQLPVADHRRLRASNLVVRSHPQLQNVLVAEFLLSNDAGHEQGFPQMLLQFSDNLGQTVASRLLKPEDYLRGEMAGAKTLPARQSVLISLELLDPGPKATGYRLEWADRP